MPFQNEEETSGHLCIQRQRYKEVTRGKSSTNQGS